MDEFRLPDDQEKIRASVFPDMSPSDFAAMRERHRGECAALPQAEQERIVRRLDELDRDMAASRAVFHQNQARFWTNWAIRTAKWPRPPAP